VAEIEVEPIAGLLGAVVKGLDPSRVDAGVAASLSQALSDHHVLFVPGLDPTLAGLRDLGAALGELDTHPFLSPVDPAIPEVIALDSSDTPKADVWHTDATFKQHPPVAALLHMVDCPPFGGDTMWINCHAVYESLSPAMQDFLLSLSCIHDDGGQGSHTAEHPVVRRHPQTGHAALYVHKQFSRRIPQLSRPESQALLAFLFRWQEQVKFSCRWRWSPGDVALWDERVTLHAVVDDTDDRRVLRRATVIGDDPVAFAPERVGDHYVTSKTASSGFYGTGRYEF